MEVRSTMLRSQPLFTLMILALIMFNVLFLITLFTRALWELKGNNQRDGSLNASPSTIQRGALDVLHPVYPAPNAIYSFSGLWLQQWPTARWRAGASC